MISAATASTHLLAHLAIFAGYIAAAVVVAPTIDHVVPLRWYTKVAGAGFFLTCGITHLGLTFDLPNSLLLTVNDHLQGVFIWAFLITLYRDLHRALRAGRR